LRSSAKGRARADPQGRATGLAAKNWLDASVDGNVGSSGCLFERHSLGKARKPEGLIHPYAHTLRFRYHRLFAEVGPFLAIGMKRPGCRATPESSSSSSTASIRRADYRLWREALRMYRRKLAPKLALAKAARYDDDLIRIEFGSNSAQHLFDEPPFQNIAD
jgi:hypothetical protein